MPRVRLNLSPVAILTGGSVLSIALAIVFYITQDAAMAFATFAGLLGLILTFQLEILALDQRRAEHEGQMGRLIDLMEKIPGMPERINDMLKATNEVEQRFPESPAIDACNLAFQRCQIMLQDLQNGRFDLPADDNMLNNRLCGQMKTEMLATSYVAVDIGWWDQPDHRDYIRLQKEALARGVRIRRVFIHNGWDDDIERIARSQHDAGFEVRRIHADMLPPDRRGIIGAWDDNCAMETHSNAAGEAVKFVYFVAPNDISRIKEQFEYVWTSAVSLDDAEPTVPRSVARS